MFKPDDLKSYLIFATFVSLPVSSAEIIEKTGFSADVDLSLSTDDNILRNELGLNDESLVLAPNLSYAANTGKQEFYFKYLGEYRAFNQHDNLNYSNHDFLSEARFIFTDKFSASAEAFLNENIDPVNTTYSSEVLTDFNQLETQGISATVKYGTFASTGQIVIAATKSSVEYNNNEQSFRNVDVSKLNATFYYRMAPKTRLLLSATSTVHEYDLNSSVEDQSSKTITTRFGAEWELTAQTTGRVEIGYFDKKMDSPLLNDIDGLSFMVSLNWQPFPFTNIIIHGDRSTRESSIVGSNAFINTKLKLGLQYNVTERTFLNLRLISEKADLESRNDDVLATSLGLEHNLREWLDLELFYEHNRRDSDISIYTYDANIYGIKLSTSF